MAMTLIQRINVTTSANLAYSFTSIPQTYTDLFLVITSQSAGTNGDALFIQMNSDTGNNYSGLYLRYNQSVGPNGGYQTANAYINPAPSPGQTTYPNYAGGTTVYFPNYTNTSIAKGLNSRGGTSLADSTIYSTTGIIAEQWSGTAAISTITLSGYGLYPTSNSTYTLYGVS